MIVLAGLFRDVCARVLHGWWGLGIAKVVRDGLLVLGGGMFCLGDVKTYILRAWLNPKWVAIA